MSSIYTPHLAESTSMNEGALKEEDQAMLQKPDHDVVHDDIFPSWPDHGRGVMSRHDRFIPKQLLLFDPLPLSQYSCPTFLHQDQEHESEQMIVGGLNDAKIYDRGVISDDPYPRKQNGIINGHDQCREHDHIGDGHDAHPHQYGGHRHSSREQQRFSTDCINCSNNQVRTCVDCNTTKTPLWRSGPLGPKSLCNACGIRHHKARRARAATSAAAQSGGNLCFSPTKSKSKKEKRANHSKPNGRPKRKNKIFASKRGRKRICLDLNLNCEEGDDDSLDQYAEETTEATTLDLSVEVSESKPFSGAFPKDEEQAAILLMALSCGLVHG